MSCELNSETPSDDVLDGPFFPSPIESGESFGWDQVGMGISWGMMYIVYSFFPGFDVCLS